MTEDRSHSIAVTGIAGRFPACASVEEWWSALRAGRILTMRYARDQLLDAGVPAVLVDDPDYVPVRAHLVDADRFDNLLFGISPRDAEMMDPQHRLMLETAWVAFEDAAAFVEPIPTTGVFASQSGSPYLRAMLSHSLLDPATLDQALHGTEPDFIASLISYKLGLTGPAVAVQTACSSGLVAVHLAVQALLHGDCDQALVIAAGIDFPQAGYLHLPGGIQSPSGECRPFDEGADGVVGGSGAAAIVLRRLPDALVDGPQPYGIILGSAINNDGAAKAGYFAPSVSGQEAVIRSAYIAAGIDASSVGYLEAHGTGTRVGDPIEWSAASEALTNLGACRHQIAVGAVKANIGHLDAAAGIAGLIKALLVVRDGVVPPLAGFRRLNPLLESDTSPLFVPTQAHEWAGPEPRRAGVSSFGIGGTNAHVIVQAPPESSRRPSIEDGQPQLLLLSAAEPGALVASAKRISAHLAASDPPLADVAFTLARGRRILRERLAVVDRTTIDVAARLANGDSVGRGSCPSGGAPPVVFLFPGQGAQHPAMAAPLARTLPEFNEALDRCLEAFDSALRVRLRQALFDSAFPAFELDATELAQPALFVVEYAAASALMQIGVVPAAVVGHSLGELTAACVAGVLDLTAAARFVTVRGRVMQACPPGVMLALACDEDHARRLIRKAGVALDIAAINAPDLCVVAGAAEPVDAFRSSLGDGIWSKVLRTSHAFHSSLMNDAVVHLAREVSSVRLQPPTIPLAANATGELLDENSTVDPSLFVDQARRPVRFADALAAVKQRFEDAVFVEVGPGRALSVIAEACGLTATALAPGRAMETMEEVLTALGRLWTQGQQLRLAAVYPGGQRIHLPGYSFVGRPWIAPEARGHSRVPIGPRTEVISTSGEENTKTSSAAPSTDRVTVKQVGVEGRGRAADVSTLIVDFWVELLGHTDLNDDSDFFDLGGDSLLITHLARRLKESLGVQVPLREMLAARTLGRQRKVVAELLCEPASSRGTAAIVSEL